MALHAVELRSLSPVTPTNPAPSRQRGPRHVHCVAPGPVRRLHVAPAAVALTHWALYALVVVLGIGAFLGLDHLRTVAGHALTDGRPPVTAAPSGAALRHAVQPGDTLWSIAVALRPGADPRPLVDQLVALNGGTELQAGGTVLIPAGAVERAGS